MGIREVTGYVAHVLLAAYWLWVVACTAPQLRKGARCKGLKMRILLVKTAAFLLTAVLVGVIHYWATALWQVAVAIPVAGVLGVLLRRWYRRLVAAPKHLRTLGQRARSVHTRRADDTPPAHSHRPVPSRESSIVMNPTRPAPGRSAVPHQGVDHQLRDAARASISHLPASGGSAAGAGRRPSSSSAR